ncbi:MAG: tol-pal system-associated acyl-CoA thioesterase [Zetaproteobacteria bacterium CG06_land_8_20_14_3_00_59_53]|nr:MAG: tol-pal system-associated acyl-CoA thioesterase [Zetaproteobacteria bacterium CG2_30_59_37]PIO90178.1 MAG: tol-pal system-associated acyl-CoA thioesterase [Zetaproteobacteria bacterium CG23_combo_of_CG06-09_8_20_14_all_59_86]PIQ64897.1 MAG: tol-pal system-associated acyl-CoA thioesterase [Zetaproteobacteria bacterium CG11_big_fil_rev_8_21_14_0_20_59_439]PIU69579.1 MAG: tol-pal system-associated acyl-CoA thioesterase [Zetaproteobacteria bacterium CG06_land_8_20_14_3_00_59_53]PIU96858.1 M
MKLPGHRFELRIYYEDTDHGGVVYYANYLKYMERARTEFMRCLGIDLGLLQHDDGVLFAVTEAHVHYRRPARFNDALCVVSSLGCAKGARLGFHQAVLRGSELLVDGEIHLACIDTEGRARRIPQAVLTTFAQAVKQPAPRGMRS